MCPPAWRVEFHKDLVFISRANGGCAGNGRAGRQCRNIKASQLIYESWRRPSGSRRCLWVARIQFAAAGEQLRERLLELRRWCEELIDFHRLIEKRAAPGPPAAEFAQFDGCINKAVDRLLARDKSDGCQEAR